MYIFLFFEILKSKYKLKVVKNLNFFKSFIFNKIL